MSDSFIAAPGGGIVPVTPSNDNSRVRRAAVRLISLLPRLPERFVHRILLSGQNSTRPSDKILGVTPVAEEVAGGVGCTWLAPDMAGNGVIVFLHGGSYTSGPVGQQWAWLLEIQRRAEVAAVMVLYRMPPRHPFPAALDDSLAAITALHAQGRLRDGQWILGGDSAGGGLALAVAQALRDSGGPQAAGLVLTAPWVDVAMENPDMGDPRRRDLVAGRSMLRWAAEMYANGVTLDDPRLSPLNASMVDLPPVHVNVGTNDIFLADIRRLRAALDEAGVTVTSIEQEGAGHTYPQQVTTSEAEWTIRSQVQWIGERLTRPTSADSEQSAQGAQSG